MSQEPLEYVPLDKWSELQNVFKKDWPRGVSGYMILETQRNIISKGLDYGFIVYCPFGDVRNGMVAINKRDLDNEIIIQCPEDNIEKLEEALRNTKRIDWQKQFSVPFAPCYIIETVQRALNHLKTMLLPADNFFYDKSTPFEGTVLPPGVSFGLVPSKFLDLVDSTWPYRYDSSRWYFQLLMNMEYGYGLFEGEELISWVFYNESGVLLHLYTPENHRRKGYAELLLKLVSNVLVKEGRPVIAYCIKGNINAYKLFKKLDFMELRPVAWIYT